MFRIIKNFLSKEEVKEYKDYLDTASFIDGKTTATGIAKDAKNNLQLDAVNHKEFIDKTTNRIASDKTFLSLTLAQKIIPITVGKYLPDMQYDNHMDNVHIKGVRTDMSFTLFLNEPDTYEGGALIVETELGEKKFKLDAGDMVVYPSLRLHRVEEVTKGERVVIISWIESKVKDTYKRDMLIQMQDLVNTLKLRANEDDIMKAVKLNYQLKHMWSDNH